MPPAFFTRVDTPQPYDFEDNSFLRRQGSKGVADAVGTTEAKMRSTWIEVHVMRFREGVVPSTTPDGADDQIRGRNVMLLESLRKLFEERPIWLRGSLEERLLPEVYTVSCMQKALMCISYYWSDGPWRNTYVRLGWDPRQNPEEAKWLQVIDFRDRHFRQSRAHLEVDRAMRGAQDTSTASGGQGDCHFRTPPAKRSQLYQFVDIEDEGICEIIQTSEVLTECCEKTGWMSEASLDQARDRMAVKSELMRRSALTGANAICDIPGSTSTTGQGAESVAHAAQAAASIAPQGVGTSMSVLPDSPVKQGYRGKRKRCMSSENDSDVPMQQASPDQVALSGCRVLLAAPTIQDSKAKPQRFRADAKRQTKNQNIPKVQSPGGEITHVPEAEDDLDVETANGCPKPSCARGRRTPGKKQTVENPDGETSKIPKTPKTPRTPQAPKTVQRRRTSGVNQKTNIAADSNQTSEKLGADVAVSPPSLQRLRRRSSGNAADTPRAQPVQACEDGVERDVGSIEKSRKKRRRVAQESDSS
jgi:hypothetical protein